MSKTELKSYCQITMTEEDARIFYIMRKYQDIFEKAFMDLRPGSLVLHFSSEGEIKKHEMHFYKTVDNLQI